MPTDGSEILEYCEELQKDDIDWSSDCADVTNFYDGATNTSDEDDQDIGLIENFNFLIGRETIQKSRDNQIAFITKPKRIWSLALDEAPLEQKSRWQNEASRIINDAIKTSSRFRRAYSEVCDRAALHGDPVFYYTDPYCPFPSAGRILVSRKAPLDVHDDQFAYWAVSGYMSVSTILTMLKSKVRRKHWMVERAKTLLDNFLDTSENVPYEPGTGSISNMSPEEIAENCQSGGRLHKLSSTRIPVFYYYKKDLTKPGRPVSMFIVSKYGDGWYYDDKKKEYRERRKSARTPKGRPTTKPVTVDPLLFEATDYFENVDRCIFPMILDCSLGGENRWSRIKGLGHQNYVPDQLVNQLVSLMYGNTKDRAMSLYQVMDDGDRKELEQWIRDGYRSGGVMPSGIQVFDKGTNNLNPEEALTLIQYFQSVSNINAVGHTGTSPPQSEDELVVQALQRQQDGSKASSNRAHDWAGQMDPVGREIFRRIIEGSCLPNEPGYDVQEQVKADLLKELVPIEALTDDNISVKFNRVLGDGDPGRRQLITGQLLENNALFAPGVQQDILREWTAAITDDYDKADQYVPEIQEPDHAQVNSALTESNTMLNFGLTLPTSNEDVHQEHVQIHLSTLQGLLEAGTTAGKFTPQQSKGFESIAGHTLAHVAVIGQRNPELANNMKQIVVGLAKEAQGPENNMIAAEQAKAENEQINPMEAAKLQLAAAEHQRKLTNDQNLQNERQNRGETQRNRDSDNTTLRLMDLNLREEDLVLKSRDQEIRRELARQSAKDND